ncbi:MAG TPA: hypothetical protein VHA76_06280 [Solirubrobacterales bacterium]|nr:hypothetical protein [Solirubrobacterales bacterium]
MKKKPILVPLGVALAALFPHGAQAKVVDTGASLGRAQVTVVQGAGGASDLLALPASDPAMAPFGHHSHYSHSSHHSHHSHHSHYSSSGGGGHYSHSSHSSHSSHYSSS